jgi:hypothetical protein
MTAMSWYFGDYSAVILSINVGPGITMLGDAGSVQPEVNWGSTEELQLPIGNAVRETLGGERSREVGRLA